MFMNSFKSSYKTMKLAYWLVVLTLALLPWAAMSNAIMLLAILVLSVIVMTIKNIKGATFVIIAIGICLPFLSGADDTTKEFIAVHFCWLNRALYISILTVFIFYLSGRKKTEKFLPILALQLISIGLVIDSLRFGISEAISALYTILAIPIMFYNCYKGRENWNDIFQMFTVLFIGMSIYAILDFFFKIGPYVPLHKGSIFYLNDFFRTGSLLGNSLCLTAFLMAYHVVLFINNYLTGKFNSWLVALSILVLLLTGSRTAFVVLIAVWFMFIVYLNRGANGHGRIVGVMLVVAITLACFVMLLFGDYVSMFFERFSEGSEHRESGLQTTINILSVYPLGLGYEGVGEMLELYSAEGWSGGMKTVDNVFLTFLITSGILSFLPFMFYFFVLLNAIFRSQRNHYYRIVVMLFIPYVLCGMSFNVNAFIQLNVLYFGVAGHMYRIIKNKTLYGLVNNHC